MEHSQIKRNLLPVGAAVDLHPMQNPLPAPSTAVATSQTDTVRNSKLPAASESAIGSTMPPPPDGGIVAWLQVLGCFFCWFNTWGLTNAFGVFQNYYQSELLQNQTPEQISWIGSLQSFLLVSVGVLTGPAYDAGYFNHLIWAGSFLVVFGYMMTSLCNSYWQVMLTQGLIIGVGAGSLFIPSVSVLPPYFSTKRALANGIAASGSSLGGVIYPIAFRQLLPLVGFGWSVRILAFLALSTCAVSLTVLKVRVKSPKRRLLFDVAAFKEPPFALFTCSLFFALMSLYIPAFYIQSFAVDENITNTNLATFILPILNAGGVFGRVVPNFFADKTGPMNMLIPFLLLAGIMAFIMIAVVNTGGLVIFALIYGFCSGAILSLPTHLVVSLSPTLEVIGTRMGTSFSIASLGLLIGTPVSGSILRNTGKYLGLQAFTGAILLLSSALLGVARYCKVGLKGNVKV